MQIIIKVKPSDFDQSEFDTPNVHWIIGHNEESDERLLERKLISHNAQALICDGIPSADILSKWVSGRREVLYVISPNAPDYTPPEGVEFYLSPVDRHGIGESLALLERRFLFENIQPFLPTGKEKRSVILVGAGITNLVLASVLIDNGYKIEIFDSKPKPGNKEWSSYGCSHGGGDARMFTLTEMDSYSNPENYVRNDPRFEKKVSEGGWMIQQSSGRSKEETAWINTHNMVPPWLASTYRQDIYQLSAEAKELWDKFITNNSNLFEDVVYRKGIMRLYSSKKQFERDILRHTRLDALKKVYRPTELKEHFPVFAEVCDKNQLAGGILAKGFTVNLHKFTQKLLLKLTDAGVIFHWNTDIEKIVRNRNREVVGMLSDNIIFQADHYVVSPGVFGTNLTQDTECEGIIHGVLGAWLEIPNVVNSFEYSMKLAWKGHIAEDSNITLARDENGNDILIIGSGYGYVGNYNNSEYPACNINQDELTALYKALDDTATKYFLGFVGKTPHVKSNYKYCVRPWTPTSLGLYHCEASDKGGALIIVGGHNTGGFAQATVIADAVLSTFRHEKHKMHYVYHPSRHKTFTASHSKKTIDRKESFKKKVTIDDDQYAH